MDVDRFLRELPELFDDFPDSELPRDVCFAEILGPGECFVEAGTYRGTSLIAAMLDNEDREFVALDDWSLGEGGREQLEASLARFGLAGRATLIEGDAHASLRSGALAGRRVGV